MKKVESYLSQELIDAMEAYSWLLYAHVHLRLQFSQGDRQAKDILRKLYMQIESRITSRLCGSLEAQGVIRKDRAERRNKEAA